VIIKVFVPGQSDVLCEKKPPYKAVFNYMHGANIGGTE